MRTFTKEQVIATYQDSPKLVRDVFNAEETVAVIRDIRTRYNLHIDTAGTLGENVGYMLIGLLSPSEFFGEMVLSGVDQEVAKSILEALNTRIFIPLRDRMKQGGDAPTTTAPPISYADTPVVREEIKREPAIPPPAIIPEPQPVKPAAVVQEKPSYNLIPTPPDQFQIRTMASDMALIKEGGFPGSLPAQRPLTQNLRPEQATPSRSFQTASVPMQVSAPTFTPTAQPSVFPLPVEPVPVQSVVPPTAPAPAPAPNIVSKTPSTDPYRESF
ncbi:MAG: hypothetical protein JWL75_183 [Parcubacteria group bacterium]|nr:hypothetical protein [Parcubacteria group bacterium]